MKSRTFRSFSSPAMIVAMIALFVALSGISYAAGLKKNSVGTKQLKKNSVTSVKIKKGAVSASDVKSDSLSGTQINESTLAKVPDADKIDGIDGAALATKSQILSWNVAMNRGDAPRVLGTLGALTFTGRCEVTGPNSSAYVDVTTSVNDAYADGDSDFDIGETEPWTSYTNFAPNTRSYTSDEPYFLDPVSGASALDGDGESAGIWAGFPGADCRFVANMPIALP